MRLNKKIVIVTGASSNMIKPYFDDPQAKKVLEERLPLARVGELKDVANTSLYLASNESNLVARTILNLNGSKIDSEG